MVELDIDLSEQLILINYLKSDILRERFINIHPSYKNLDRYDLGSAVYDWGLEYIENLRYLLKETGAKIVISSWRERKSLSTLKLLFKNLI